MTYLTTQDSPQEVLNELTHYGVLGMKWGVRKDRSTKGRTRKSKKPVKDADKSAYRIRTEARYVKKGHTKEQAAIKAAGRIRAEKILLALGATAAVSYAGKTIIDKSFRGVNLPAGAMLTNINALGEKQDFDRRLYTSFLKGDTKRYKGLLGSQLRWQLPLTQVYETKLKATTNIKAPSQAVASHLFNEFKQKHEGLKNTNYFTFNKGLIYNNPTNQDFYDFMRSKGFNAILDANDQFLSGYKAKKPLILFNAASSTVKHGEQVLSRTLTNKIKNQQTAILVGQTYAPYMGLGLAVAGGTQALDTKIRYGAVNKYFKDHPESELSYAEVYSKLKQKPTGAYYYAK